MKNKRGHMTISFPAIKSQIINIQVALCLLIQHLDKMDKFLKRHKLAKVDKKQKLQILKKLIFQNVCTKHIPAPDDFTDKSSKTFKDNYNLIQNLGWSAWRLP